MPWYANFSITYCLGNIDNIIMKKIPLGISEFIFSLVEKKLYLVNFKFVWKQPQFLHFINKLKLK